MCAVAQAENGPALLPLECPYLNRTALHSLVGHQAPPSKHFTLKRKPKSAALRAELTQKGMLGKSFYKPSGSLRPTVQLLLGYMRQHYFYFWHLLFKKLLDPELISFSFLFHSKWSTCCTKESDWINRWKYSWVSSQNSFQEIHWTSKYVCCCCVAELSQHAYIYYWACIVHNFNSCHSWTCDLH